MKQGYAYQDQGITHRSESGRSSPWVSGVETTIDKQMSTQEKANYKINNQVA